MARLLQQLAGAVRRRSKPTRADAAIARGCSHQHTKPGLGACGERVAVSDLASRDTQLDDVLPARRGAGQKLITPCTSARVIFKASAISSSAASSI
jgi:hypothetical protein